MQVLLKRSESNSDIQCTVCGQGFRLYWERTSPAERETMRAIVLGELRTQHTEGADNTPTVHPEAPFNMPNWSGSPQFSGAALLGGLSGIRRSVPRSSTR